MIDGACCLLPGVPNERAKIYVYSNPANMKKPFAFLTVVFFTSVCMQVAAQIRYSESVFITSPEFDTRASTSLKVGVSNIYIKECEKYCFKMYYHQIQAKYNFSKEALGLQTAVGYSNLFGGRVGIDYEYGVNTGSHDLMTFVTAGVDMGGAASLQCGPKFNLTQNNSSKAVLFMVVVDFPLGLFFQKGKAKEAIQGIKASKPK
jgi:hypothetical protein